MTGLVSRCCLAGCFVSLLTLRALGLPSSGDELAQRASWSVPQPEQVRKDLEAVLEARGADASVRGQIDALWTQDETAQPELSLLQRVAASLALVDPQAQEIVEFCATSSRTPNLPNFPLLEDPQQPAMVRHNLRLLYGQWLAQHDYYDEALAVLESLQPEDVVDPAALLFYQTAGYHRMPDKQKCLPLAARLLENEKLIPRRHATIARLIQSDLETLKPDSLDEIARLMDEVERRLDLNRAGKRVRDQEDEVIAKLDKLIKKLEEQQQQQQAAMAANLTPSNPAQDSLPAGGKGPGNVDIKSIGTKSGWGNLPPKERQEALQQISKDLPAHYREVIEEYFRKLAREGGAGN